ncbi:MAG: UpxY family transcription antiterminator [Balneolaceae bacterium]|nr:UpxY family transcription antiterminator [Balneolaceae bacterium]
MAKQKNQVKRWLAFYVKPRHEKRVAERLQNDGVEVFCPLMSIKVRWSDRWKKIQKPVITGYIFARVTEIERLEVLNDPGIWRTVFWKGRPALIRDDEIEIMRHFLNRGDNVKLEPFRTGDRVKVTDRGNMLGIAGMGGVVIKVKGNQVSLRLESLQARLSMTVPTGMLTRYESIMKID